MSKNEPKKTLEEDGIDIKPAPFIAKDCPDKIRVLFKLIHDVKSLSYDTYGRLALIGGPKYNQEARSKAAEGYEEYLLEQADKLLKRSSNPDLLDRPEAEWVQKLGLNVFFKFDRDEDETADLHHCFICRRHYPQHSRPFINRTSERVLQKHPKFPSGTEICYEHVNLPNFASHSQLEWFNDDDADEDPQSKPEAANSKKRTGPRQGTISKGYETPDLTIGLCTYGLQESPWIDRDDLLELDQVRLFDRVYLSTIQKKIQFPVLYRRAAQRIIDSSPQFPFAIWEAKSAVENANKALMQSARKVKTMLKYQSQIYSKSLVAGIPLGWYFNNVGSFWKVYGCHVDGSRSMQPPRYVLRELWSGDVREESKALQILYIVDIIALWAEHTYKPSICLCLRNLEALINDEEGKSHTEGEETRGIEKVEINIKNFPWLFNPYWNISQPEQVANKTQSYASSMYYRMKELSLETSAIEPMGTRSGRVKLHNKGQNQTIRSLSESPDRGRVDETLADLLLTVEEVSNDTSLLSLTQSMSKEISSRIAEDAFIIPKLHNYIWIQDRDPGRGDILVLNISNQGVVMKPTVVFASHLWKEKQFRKLVVEERRRWHRSVETGFIYDRKEHYMHRLILKYIIGLADPEIQFCGIFPLDEEKYESSYWTGKDDYFFRPIEDLLNIQDLLRAVRKSSGRWCSCRKVCNEYSPPMILCDNVKCEIGWYHKECVGMDDDDEYMLWLCPLCKWTKRYNYIKDRDVEYDENLFEESDKRVQITKTVARVWAKHEWPAEDRMMRLMEKISRRIDFDSSVQYKIPTDGHSQERAPHGCWSVPRSLQKKPKMMKVVSSGLGFDVDESRRRGVIHESWMSDERPIF